MAARNYGKFINHIPSINQVVTKWIINQILINYY